MTDGLKRVVLLTSLEEASRLELIYPKQLRPHTDESYSASLKVRLQLADLWGSPPADLTAKPPQKEKHHGLLPPQRPQFHFLRHKEGITKDVW